MDKKSWIGILLIVCLIFQVLVAPLAFAQEGAAPIRTEKPVMENVFFNVVWGSVLGIILGLAVVTIEADEPTAPDDPGNAAFEGATGGGILGLAVGLWLVATGVSFDGQQSLLFSTADNGHNPQLPTALRPSFPITLETTTNGPLRITGVKATVFELKF